MDESDGLLRSIHKISSFFFDFHIMKWSQIIYKDLVSYFNHHMF